MRRPAIEQPPIGQPAIGSGDLSPAPASSSEEVYGAIRRGILDGSLRPGERIVEQRLAKLLRVSRTPVREALHKLERENLVAPSGRGMAVRSFSAEEVRDIYDLRAHLESYAARRAAARATPEEIANLRAVQDRLLATVATPEGDDVERLRALARLNQQFHMLVVHAARSAPLERILDGIIQTPLIYKAYLWYGEAERRRSAEGHEELLRLLESGDAAAAEALWLNHIRFGRDVLVERLLAQRALDDVDF